MPSDQQMTFSAVVAKLVRELQVDIKKDDLGLDKRTVAKIEGGAASAEHHYNASALWEALRQKFADRCKNKNPPDSFSFAFEVIGDPLPGSPVDTNKMTAFLELARQQYLRRKGRKRQPGSSEHSACSGSTAVRKLDSRDLKRQVPTISLFVRSPGEEFQCVNAPETARLQRRGLLPLPYNAAAQLRVNFGKPQHFCLFAFGPDLKVHRYVPHRNLPAGRATDRLVVPDDLVPDTKQIPFEGVGGAESFLMLVGRRPLTEAIAVAAQKALQRIVRGAGTIRLPYAELPFVKDGTLKLPETKALPLSKAERAAEPINGLLAKIESEFAGHFAGFHFLSVYRSDPPQDIRQKSGS
jgi:hypothetical protein